MISNHLKNIRLLLQTGAPLRVFLLFYYSTLRYRLNRSRNRKNNRQMLSEWAKYYDQLEITTDWFSRKIPVWNYVFDRLQITEVENYLEIGSWEGLSTSFIAHRFPLVKAFCVDTWQGSEEHASLENTSGIFERFKKNTGNTSQIELFQGTSRSFFEHFDRSVLFDLMYIDGSHYVDDVIMDAFSGFQLLKKGGVMIFDDYLWKRYEHPQDNPAAACNAFLKIKSKEVDIIHVGYQVIIQKK